MDIHGSVPFFDRNRVVITGSFTEQAVEWDRPRLPRRVHLPYMNEEDMECLMDEAIESCKR